MRGSIKAERQRGEKTMEMNKKTIALVNVTMNAVNPMVRYLTVNEPEWKVRPYLDSYLLEKIGIEGKVSDDSVGRMLEMITKACKDGADAVLVTCTIFSAFQPYFSKIFSVPILTPDGAMLDEVSKKKGKKAIICTFHGTVDVTQKQYETYCEKNHMPKEADMYTVPDAFAAAGKSDMETCYRIIREKVMELDEQYDHIVLAQISMAGAADGLHTKHASVYTSPKSAVEALKKTLHEN